MKRVIPIPRAFVPALDERAEILRFAPPTGLPTFNTQPEPSPRLYKAGVLIGDFLSSVLHFILLPTLRYFGKGVQL